VGAPSKNGPDFVLDEFDDPAILHTDSDKVHVIDGKRVFTLQFYPNELSLFPRVFVLGMKIVFPRVFVLGMKIVSSEVPNRQRTPAAGAQMGMIIVDLSDLDYDLEHRFFSSAARSASSASCSANPSSSK
jgi:hypothetical protein